MTPTPTSFTEQVKMPKCSLLAVKVMLLSYLSCIVLWGVVSIEWYEGPVQVACGKGSGSCGSLKNAHIIVTEAFSFLSRLTVPENAWIGSRRRSMKGVYMHDLLNTTHMTHHAHKHWEWSTYMHCIWSWNFRGKEWMTAMYIQLVLLSRFRCMYFLCIHTYIALSN